MTPREAPAPPARRLTVTGDDFGASVAANEGIIRAHREGILTAASLMAGGEAFDDAVRLAREHPALSVGLHVTVVKGRAVLPHAEIPHITDRGGRFSENLALAGLRYFFSPGARAEVRREVAAQFARAAGAGVAVAHVDGHCHMHAHPVVFGAALAGAMRCGARRMRVPVEDLRAALQYDRSDRVSKGAQALAFGLLARHMRRALRRAGVGYCDRVFGLFQTGRADPEWMLHVLAHLPAGATEVYLHPEWHEPPRSLREARGVEELCAVTSGLVVRHVLGAPGLSLEPVPGGLS